MYFYTCNNYMGNFLIKNGTTINEDVSTVQDVYIKGERIHKIGSSINPTENFTEINAEACIVMPGVIDDQVHFREPGLIHKATIGTEAAAAVAGGTTTFMEMPNTVPNALTFELLQQKYDIAAASSLANYSFFMGVSNTNADEALLINKYKQQVCGLKIFMGSSTGNMLVDNYLTLNKVFSNSEVLIATHCEREEIVTTNQQNIIEQYGQDIDASYHPIIRNTEACFESSYSAVQLAKQTGARLHVLHITTAKELQLFGNLMPLDQKQITSEVCVHHLHFTADDYAQLGNLIKCNPAIKAAENKEALWQGLLDDRLDIIATDHAPHTWDEKQQAYLKAPAGLPLVQHSLQLMLQYAQQGAISLPQLVHKMCHAPAICFQVAERGYLREGYYADVAIAKLQQAYTVSKQNILFKCGWSPLEGTTFNSSIAHTFVSGHHAWDGTQLYPTQYGKRITFNRQ
jgi:dihydroorotase